MYEGTHQRISPVLRRLGFGASSPPQPPHFCKGNVSPGFPLFFFFKFNLFCNLGLWGLLIGL